MPTGSRSSIESTFSSLTSRRRPHKLKLFFLLVSCVLCMQVSSRSIFSVQLARQGWSASKNSTQRKTFQFTNHAAPREHFGTECHDQDAALQSTPCHFYSCSCAWNGRSAYCRPTPRHSLNACVAIIHWNSHLNTASEIQIHRWC